MIRLSNTTKKLQAVLGGAITTSQPQAVVSFYDQNNAGEQTRGADQETNLNSTTDVDICNALGTGKESYTRNIDSLTIYNKDTVSATVTVKIDDGGTESILKKVILATQETLSYDHESGWSVQTANGAIKSASGGAGIADAKAIYGLTYSNNGSDSTNDIDIAAGGCMDATGVYFMRLGSTLTKQLDAAWAVGTNAGGLDTGTIGNSDYYIWLIARSDTGVVDALFSLSSTAPTMPSNYDYKRLIGWIKRSGGAIVAFHTYETDGGGIELNWDAPTLDVNLANTLTTTRRTDAVKVPLNFSVVAHLNVSVQDSVNNGRAIICCPDMTDAAPSPSAAPLANFGWTATNGVDGRQLKVRTSSAGLVAARSTEATTDLYAVVTVGFDWARRN